MTTLRSFPGSDIVKLCIVRGDDTVNLRMNNITTGYCEELKLRLLGIVGENGFTMEKSAVN